MNIVIIDDEPVILSGISKMIPQMHPDWHVYAMFTDAAEALGNCNWDDVHVLLADISMPGMDGLSLIAALRENGFETLVVFITAHASFAYAQRGAHLNMFDYLLKPVARAALSDVLARAERYHEKVRAGIENAEYIRQNLHTLQKHFLGDVLFEERLIAGPEMQQRMQDYRLVGQQYLIALLKTGLPRPQLKNDLGSRLAGRTWMLYGQEQCFELLLFATGQADVPWLHAQLGALGVQWVGCDRTLSMEELAVAFRQLLPQETIAAEEVTSELLPAEHELPLSIRLARQYIDQHYAERISLRSIADAVYLHPTYLSNVFRKQTGMGVVDYINAVRIAQAKGLLVDPRNRIYWIVEQVGFSNQRYFSYVFKALTGQTPMQYRQQRLMLTGLPRSAPEA